MSEDAIVDNNIVTVIGKIKSGCTFSHEVYGEGFYTFTVLANRLSENYDELPITVSERLINKDDILPDKFVAIKGQLRSYNSFSDMRNKLVLTVFAREIELFDALPDGNSNVIELNGYICKTPIYRQTPFGREITDVLVAVNRAYNKSDYIPCIAWGRNARFVGKLNVGDNIRVFGRIQSRQYQKKTEDKTEEKIAYEVSLSRIELIGKKDD